MKKSLFRVIGILIALSPLFLPIFSLSTDIVSDVQAVEDSAGVQQSTLSGYKSSLSHHMQKIHNTLKEVKDAEYAEGYFVGLASAIVPMGWFEPDCSAYIPDEKPEYVVGAALGTLTVWSVVLVAGAYTSGSDILFDSCRELRKNPVLLFGVASYLGMTPAAACYEGVKALRKIKSESTENKA